MNLQSKEVSKLCTSLAYISAIWLFWLLSKYESKKGLADDLAEGEFSFPIIHGIQSDKTSKLLLSERHIIFICSFVLIHSCFRYTAGTIDNTDPQTRGNLLSQPKGIICLYFPNPGSSGEDRIPWNTATWGKFQASRIHETDSLSGFALTPREKWYLRGLPLYRNLVSHFFRTYIRYLYNQQFKKN